MKCNHLSLKKRILDGYGTKRDHKTGTILAFVLGTREDKGVSQAKKAT